MATAPILSQFTAVDTLGALAERVKRKINEPVGRDKMQVIYDDLADGIESLWMSMLLATLSKWCKGPVTQVIAANTTTTQLISVPDPTSAPTAFSVAGGNLASRTVYLSYALVTSSGSTTKISPLNGLVLVASHLAHLATPLVPAITDIPPDVIGWYAFAGLNPDGSDQGQQSPVPLLLNQDWWEPPAGLTAAPNAPSAPSVNTTGDNIFAIERMDVRNVDQTWTSWLQTNMGSTFWTEFQHRVPTTTTWAPMVYDLIDDHQLEVRPGPGYTASATYFYVAKPRRPRFPQSRLPFTSVAREAFLFKYGVGQYLRGIYEFEASDRWLKDAEDERLRIVLSINQGNWNKDTTVRPFMR